MSWVNFNDTDNKSWFTLIENKVQLNGVTYDVDWEFDSNIYYRFTAIKESW